MGQRSTACTEDTINAYPGWRAIYGPDTPDRIRCVERGSQRKARGTPLADGHAPRARLEFPLIEGSSIRTRLHRVPAKGSATPRDEWDCQWGMRNGGRLPRCRRPVLRVIVLRDSVSGKVEWVCCYY